MKSRERSGWPRAALIPRGRVGSRHGVALLLVAFIAHGACREAPGPSRGAPPPRGDASVRLKLPGGWTFETAGGVIRAGPATNHILSIERRPASRADWVDLARLERLLRAAAAPSGFQVVKRGSHAFVYRIESGSRATYALVGLIPLERDVYLCSTAPGAPREAVEQALTICSDVAGLR